YQQAGIVCLSGGKGNSENGNESPWKALEKAVGNFKKDRSIEDVLRQQIEKQEYYDDGGNDGKRPGGGGGGGDGDGDYESKDESLSRIWDEFVSLQTSNEHPSKVSHELMEEVLREDEKKRSVRRPVLVGT
ncbi:hypothetical protein Salat_0983800, partial [Sesamum alatum]